MKVIVSSALHAYTGRRSSVEAEGGTLEEVTRSLDRTFPGLRFRIVDEQGRIRPHIKFFVNGVQTFKLSDPVAPADEVAIIQAFSGG
ncbi:MAG: sulfur transfer protein ThiS [Elusimicrobia bacterium]|nr:MAG: sulfur transfer protein ThiS [Elusimicrobiota bacterium]